MKITIGGNTFEGDNIDINGSHVKKGEILTMRANIDGVDVEFDRNTWSEHPEYDRGFEAGQQSKQAEIDALKAKIDDLSKWAEFHIEDYNLSESESEHDRGWFNAACQVFKALKGNKNDT